MICFLMEIFVGRVSFPSIILSARHCKKTDFFTTTTAAVSLSKNSGVLPGRSYNVGVNSSDCFLLMLFLNPSNILSLFHP
jgi:hypothetical protein